MLCRRLDVLHGGASQERQKCVGCDSPGQTRSPSHMHRALSRLFYPLRSASSANSRRFVRLFKIFFENKKNIHWSLFTPRIYGWYNECNTYTLVMFADYHTDVLECLFMEIAKVSRPSTSTGSDTGCARTSAQAGIGEWKIYRRKVCMRAWVCTSI